MKSIWLNGSFVPAEQPILCAGDLGVQRGYGIFDFFKFINRCPLLWDHYLKRFEASASGLGLPVEYSVITLKEVVLELIDMNNKPHGGIKLTLTGGYAGDGYTPEKPNLIITQHHIEPPTPEKYDQGFKVITHEYQRELPQLKTTNYLRGIFLQPKLRELQVDDVLYINQGLVTEFPRSNFFIVNNKGEIITPERHVLKGITRESIFSISPHPVKAQEVNLQEVLVAEEAFLTSTTKRIMPVVEVDGTPIGTGVPGTITRQLITALSELEAKEPANLPLL